MNINAPAKVAIASEFLSSFANIPKKKQVKVLEFIAKFKANPLSPAINYEKIVQFKDKTLRSVRIDKVYRGIVKKPDQGNVFLLLWVDHHDKAYQWATNKRCDINPELGCVQIYDVIEYIVEEGGETPVQTEQKNEVPPLFAAMSDKELKKIGLPERLLSLVRAIRCEEELDQATKVLPDEVAEALYMIASGFSFAEVLLETGHKETTREAVDLNDFETALQHPVSKKSFFLVDDDLDLQEILEAPLEKWRVFLHPSQRALVEKEWNGPVRVLGGAGTGKTVVAMHRAKWLAENIFTGSNDKILFTTFTRNLAADIQDNLEKICSGETMKRIEVINLDSWVSFFLRKNNYDYAVDYNGKNSKRLWDKALSLVPVELGLRGSFFREEWERVIQPNRIETYKEYLKVSRVGRGIRLNRKERKLIWPVFEEYRLLMNQGGFREIVDATRDAKDILVSKGNVLPYQAVIIDEAQDMSKQAFELIRQIIPGTGRKNDIFIVGDAHQRIYRHKVTLSHCGINIIGRGRRLKINYRTTEENRQWAVGLLKGIKVDDLDGGLDSQNGYKSLVHGEAPLIDHFTSFQEEIDFISNYLNEIEDMGEAVREICLVARTHDKLKQYEGALKSKGQKTFFVQKSEAEDQAIPGLRLATMHRVKGLEFDKVIIAGVNDGVLPLRVASNTPDDKVIERNHEVQERALLYVAVTRAKRQVIVTSFGKASGFLQDV